MIGTTIDMARILDSINREKIIANMAGIIEKYLVKQFNEWNAAKYDQDMLYEEVLQYWRDNLCPGRYAPDSTRYETKEVFGAGLSRLVKNGVISRGGVFGGGAPVEYIPRDDREKTKTYVEANKELWSRRDKAGNEILGILSRHGIEFEYQSGGYHTSERFLPKSVEDLEALAALLKTRLK